MFVYSLLFSFAVSTTSIDVGKTDAIHSTHGHLTVNVNGRGDRHTRSQLTDTSQSTKSHPTATILPVLHSRRGHTVPWPSTPFRRNPEVPTFWRAQPFVQDSSVLSHKYPSPLAENNPPMPSTTGACLKDQPSFSKSQEPPKPANAAVETLLKLM